MSWLFISYFVPPRTERDCSALIKTLFHFNPRQSASRTPDSSALLTSNAAVWVSEPNVAQTSSESALKKKNPSPQPLSPLASGAKASKQYECERFHGRFGRVADSFICTCAITVQNWTARTAQGDVERHQTGEDAGATLPLRLPRLAARFLPPPSCVCLP